MDTDKPGDSLMLVQKKNTLPIASMNDIATLGTFAAQSGMFGAKTQAEGIMVVGVCQQEGWSFADFMANFDIIKGKLGKKAAAMLADFRMRGGDYKIQQRDKNGAIVTFSRGKDTYTSECLWADALREPFIYEGKEADVVRMLSMGQKPPLKAKYSTERSRMQMLWARCVSDGLRAFAPECCRGIYTPEEVDDFAVAPITTAATKAQSVQVSAQVSPSPISKPADVTVVPAGKIAGQKWADQPLETLKQALNVTHPLFTAEMKDYIKTVIASRETAPDMQPQATEEGEVVNG